MWALSAWPGHPLVGVPNGCMCQYAQNITRVAQSVGPVLIEAPSGCGKELMAWIIHFLSDRKTGPLVPVNCAALPDALLDSEMFGHVEGAFTGAIRDRRGRLQEAQGGTLFLDEITEMCPALQAKLLRVLDGSGYSPVGSDEVITPDFRLVCATNRHLLSKVDAGEFREDLHYRIKCHQISLPALRQRQEDIIPLARHFICEFCYTHEGTGFDLEEDTEKLLLKHTWPGNVRELENVIQSACQLANSGVIEPSHLPTSVTDDVVPVESPALVVAEATPQKPIERILFIVKHIFTRYILAHKCVAHQEVLDIYRDWGTSDDTPSRHIQVIIDSGLVREIRCGRHRIYEPNLGMSSDTLNGSAFPQPPPFDGLSTAQLPLLCDPQ